MIKRLAALVALLAFFGSTAAFADCGGCPKPDKDKDKAEATLPR